MSAEKATAIVLRVVEFSETSSVVTLLTREFGKVRGLAKGARRLKGPFESALDLLALCRIVFLRKSSDALDLLTEAKLERRFRPAPGDLSSLYAGYYVAELLNELTDERDPHPELFDAADETLAALGTSGAVHALVLRFEMTALRVLGHLPLVDRCAECGVKVETSGRVPFAPLAGGILCQKCRPGKRNVVAVSSEVMLALRELADPLSETWQTINLDHRVFGELRGVLNHYFTGLLGKPLRMHRYLAEGIGGSKRRAGKGEQET